MYSIYSTAFQPCGKKLLDCDITDYVTLKLCLASLLESNINDVGVVLGLIYRKTSGSKKTTSQYKR